jgi:Spy/CpxP family protein refolding chaperone
MKKLLAFAVAAVVALSTATVFADGAGCCAAGASKSASCSGDMFSKLKLTDEQKAQIESLKQDTKRATSTSESRAMFNAGLEKILTPDQLSQLKSQCDSSKAKASSGCPYMNSQKKS